MAHRAGVHGAGPQKPARKLPLQSIKLHKNPNPITFYLYSASTNKKTSLTFCLHCSNNIQFSLTSFSDAFFCTIWPWAMHITVWRLKERVRPLIGWLAVQWGLRFGIIRAPCKDLNILLGKATCNTQYILTRYFVYFALSKDIYLQDRLNHIIYIVCMTYKPYCIWFMH